MRDIQVLTMVILAVVTVVHGALLIIVTWSYLDENKSLYDLKNGETCFDDDGTDNFSCDCIIPFGGERCEKLALCDGNLCNNGGTCTTISQSDSQLGLIDNF